MKRNVFVEYCVNEDRYFFNTETASGIDDRVVIKEEGPIVLFASGKLSVNHGIKETKHRIESARNITFGPQRVKIGSKVHTVANSEDWKEIIEDTRELCKARKDNQTRNTNSYFSVQNFMESRKKARHLSRFRLIQTNEMIKRKQKTQALPRDIMEIICRELLEKK
jgi:hypothetical protein